MFIETFIILQEGVNANDVIAFLEGVKLKIIVTKNGLIVSGEVSEFQQALGKDVMQSFDKSQLPIPERLRHLVKSILITPKLDYQ